MNEAELERQYFARGREVLGKSAGGLLAKLLKLRSHNVALARADLERASTKHEPAAYIGRILSDPGNSKLAGGTDLAGFEKNWEIRAERQLAEREGIAAAERERVGRRMEALAAKLHGVASEPGKTPLTELERLAELSAARDEVLK